MVEGQLEPVAVVTPAAVVVPSPSVVKGVLSVVLGVSVLLNNEHCKLCFSSSRKRKLMILCKAGFIKLF